LPTKAHFSSNRTSRVSGGKSHDLVVGVLGAFAGQAGQANDSVAMDTHEACGGPDATSFLEMAKDRHDRVVGELGAEEDGPFVLRERVSAAIAAEESVSALLAEAVVDREVSGVASPEGRTSGVWTAEPGEVFHRHEASWVVR
jgi:hypothetical protein